MIVGLPILSEAPHSPAGAWRRPPAAPPDVRANPRRLIDSQGRTIRDLRLSITDRCNFRCTYCMEPDVRFLEREELLDPEELARVASICVSMGVEKVRITGGEPMVHPRLMEIIERLSVLPIHDLALTTNGSLLSDDRLEAMRAAGLRRLTVSIDSLEPGRFAAITRSSVHPEQVIEGVRAAQRAGFGPVKLNAVVVRGFNEDEVASLAGLARDLGVEMRYIEFMPLDSAHAWDRTKLVPAAEIVERIAEVYPLRPVGREEASSTSLIYEFADGSPGRIGVIAPVTRPFCGACSRLRITADGKVRPCLFSREEWDLRPLLRRGGAGGAEDEEIAQFLADATWTKQAGHGISTPGFRQPDRPMSAIGG